MKKWIHATTESNPLSAIDHIDLVLIATDARIMHIADLPVVASSNNYSKDFDRFTEEELLELNNSELRQLDSPYALDTLVQAINEGLIEYNLTKKQKDLLSHFYRDRNVSAVDLSSEDVKKLITMISECKSVTGPEIRFNQVEKNFAQVHGIEISQADYLAIVKRLTYSDFKRAIKSADLDRLGILLHEFICTVKGYKLKFSEGYFPENVKIYIKIIPHYASQYNIAIISFHDADPETLADLEIDE